MFQYRKIYKGEGMSFAPNKGWKIIKMLYFGFMEPFMNQEVMYTILLFQLSKTSIRPKHLDIYDSGRLYTRVISIYFSLFLSLYLIFVIRSHPRPFKSSSAIEWVCEWVSKYKIKIFVIMHFLVVRVKYACVNFLQSTYIQPF